MSVGLWSRSGGGRVWAPDSMWKIGGGLGVDAARWAAAVAAAGGTASKAADLDACLRGMAGLGVNNANSYFLPMASDTFTGVNVPALDATSAGNATVVNFVSGDYSLATGLTGNGSSKYLNLVVQQTAWTAASRALHVYIRTRATTSINSRYLGSVAAASTHDWGLSNTASTATTRYQMSSGSTGPNDSASGAVGLVSGVSESSTSGKLYDDGTQIATNTVAAATPQALAMFAFARNNNGTADQYGNASLGCILITPTLTAGQVASLATIIQTFMTALGRNV